MTNSVVEQSELVAPRQVPNDAKKQIGRVGRARKSTFQIGLALAWLVIAVVTVAAFFPSWFTSMDPLTGVAADRLLPPSVEHLFGTDYLGRDLLSRVIYGTSQSLMGAFFAVTFGVVCGAGLGLLAGATGGILDTLVMRVVDVLLSVPSILLSLSVIIWLGYGTFNAAVAVGVTAVASFARLMRSEVIRVRSLDYVEAAFGSGCKFGTVLIRHILPNSLGAVVSLTAIQFGTAILAISTLGFLGFGTPPPTPEWGLLIAEGRDYVATAWWQTTFPGLTIVAVVMSASRISQRSSREGRTS